MPCKFVLSCLAAASRERWTTTFHECTSYHLRTHTVSHLTALPAYVDWPSESGFYYVKNKPAGWRTERPLTQREVDVRVMKILLAHLSECLVTKHIHCTSHMGHSQHSAMHGSVLSLSPLFYFAMCKKRPLFCRGCAVPTATTDGQQKSLKWV